MIERLIRASAARPALAIILALVGTTFGVMSLQNLRRDVFPDLSAPVFNVIVQNAAMGAEELETGIAIPLEAALAGLPAELAREQAAHAATRERLAYRESARGWFRLPFSLLKRRWSDPR